MAQMNMMPNGMPAQNQMNGMQRPQQGNMNQQPHPQVLQSLQQELPKFAGQWQGTFNLGLRASRIMQLFTQLRFLEPDLAKCLRTALQFENETISRAHNAETYQQNMMRKLAEISNKRNQNIGGMMNGNGPHMTPGQMPGDMSMNPNAMAARNQQPPNLGMQQPQMPNNSMNQLGAPAMQPSMSQSSHQHLATPNPQQQHQLQQPNPREVQETAARMMASISEERKAELRNNMMRTMSEQQRQAAAAQKKDPLIGFILSRARQEVMARKAAQANGGQPQQNMQSNNAGGVTMSQAASQQGNGFDFTAIMGQQANALKLQESGEQVVPASNNPNAAFQSNMNGQNAQGNGINPAMLGNGNSQGGAQMPNNMTPQQMQMLAMQREKQRQEQMRSNAARNHALQQAQLHSQGLGTQNALNGAAGGSPAMTMLNRPMQPPGSQTPNTPQQPNRAPNMQQPHQQHGQTPANGANNMFEHQQNMLNRNNSGGNMQGPLSGLPPNPIFANPQAQSIIRTMPPPVIEKLRLTATTEPQNIPALLRQWAQAHKERTQSADMQMRGPQANNQGGMNGINNAMPDMNMQQTMMPQGQPHVPPGMDPSQLQARMQQQQQLHQAQQQQQQAQQQQGQMQQGQQIPPEAMRNIPQPLRTQAMLSRPFPPGLPAQLGFAVPPQVRLWGQLKQHVEQHQASLQPGTPQKLLALISRFFQERPNELEIGIRMLLMQRQQQQHQQQQQSQGQMGNLGGQPSNSNNNMAMPNGGAPTAQMMQPNAQMSQGLGNPALGQNQLRMPPQPQIGPQEIAMFRQKFPQATNMSDDQIRAALDHSRRRSMAHQNNALRQAQMQNQIAQNTAGPQGNQQQRPPTQTPGQSLNEHMQAGPKQQAGQKRPQPASSNDDVMEIPNPNAQQNKARAGPLTGMKIPQLGGEQLAKLNPQEREQVIRRMESLRQANANSAAPQGGMPPAVVKPPTEAQQTESRNAPDARTVQRLLEEVSRHQTKGPPVQQDAAATEATINILRRLYPPYNQVDKTFTAALSLPEFTEDNIKQIMKAKIQIFHNWDDNSKGVKGYLSLSLQDVQKMQALVQTYLRNMAQAKQRGQFNQQAAQQAQAQAPQQAASAKQAGQTPAMEKTASKPGRKASSSKPPPAPTDNKSFDWATGVQSPHGVPKYEPGATQLTPDKLKFPPNKKRRTGQADSAGSTPVPAAASPSIGAPKAVSPEQLRKAQLKTEAEARDKKRWKCTKDAACEASIEGFETEEELKTHFDSAHKEIADPLQFLLDNAAQSLGVDLEGNPLPGKPSDKTKPANSILPPKTAAAMKRDPSLMKQDSRTPGSSTPATGAKGSATQAANKQATAVSDAAKPKTLNEYMAEKMGYEVTTNTENEPTTAPSTDDDKLWAEIGSTVASGLSSFEPFDFDTGSGAKIDDWGLRPENSAVHSSPETTPETDHSSRSSDVSANDRLRINMEWDAFGNGDVAVPEMLNVAVDSLGLDNAGKKQDDPEQPAGDDKAAEKKGDAAVDVKIADLDWSSDAALTWDSLFADQNSNNMQFDFSADAPSAEMDFAF